MESRKRILKVIAKKRGQDPDELLITLWDIDRGRFDYLKNEYSVIRQRDLKVIENIDCSSPRGGADNKSVTDEIIRPIHSSYDFSLTGRVVDNISYLTREDILRIHEELVDDFRGFDDPIYPSGIKNEHLLDSALFHPQTSYSGRIKYPTVESSGATLMYSISSNHPFHNGNKRTAMVALIVFLDRHNVSLNCSDDDLFKLSIMVADHRLVNARRADADSEIHELARWIRSNGRLMEKGERPITLKKLRQVLSHFGCVISDNGKVERLVEVPFMWTMRKKTLSSRKHISGIIAEGDEIDKGLIKSIREDLELDSEHGIDSKSFYGMAKPTTSEFISKYKTLLRRLSRV